MDFDWTAHPAPRFPTRGTPYVAQTYRLRSHGLPAGYGYVVHVDSEGYVTSKSDPGCNGGIRHYRWGNDTCEVIWKALDHGFAWARRHQRQLERAA
jgi:hypothetical protein